MGEQIHAPWDAETVELLNEWQQSGVFHPYTCGRDRKNAQHLDGDGVLVATADGWKCPYCEYTQESALKPLPREILEQQRKLYHRAMTALEAAEGQSENPIPR